MEHLFKMKMRRRIMIVWMVLEEVVEVVPPDRHDTWKSSLPLQRYHNHTIDRGCDQDVLEITSIKSFVCMRFHSLQCKWFIFFNIFSLFGWELYLIFNIEWPQYWEIVVLVANFFIFCFFVACICSVSESTLTGWMVGMAVWYLKCKSG